MWLHRDAPRGGIVPAAVVVVQEKIYLTLLIMGDHDHVDVDRLLYLYLDWNTLERRITNNLF